MGVPSGAYVFNPQLPGEVLGQIEGTCGTSRGKWVGGHHETRRSADDMMIDDNDGGKAENSILGSTFDVTTLN